MSLYNNLLTAHANLKKVNDAATLQIGELESSLAFMREQDRVKSKRIEELAMDKQRLENDILLLRQQVTLGVKQVELIWSAKEQRLKEDLDTTKKQLEHTKELIRNSDIETLRSQASEVHELKAREQARIANEQAEKQRQALRRSNLYSDFLTSTFAQPVADQASGEVKPGQALPTTAATGVDGDSEDDEDFVGGSSDDSGDDSTDSYDSSDDAVPPAQAPVTVASDMSGIQYPVLPASELVNAALASSEGILPGGLASISPAPVDFVTTAHVVTSVDTSGETTQVTTSASIALPDAQDPAKDYSQQVSSSETRYIESDEILELDSGVLESQLAYPCSWGKASGNECRALFSSQKVGPLSRRSDV